MRARRSKQTPPQQQQSTSNSTQEEETTRPNVVFVAGLPPSVTVAEIKQFFYNINVCFFCTNCFVNCFYMFYFQLDESKFDGGVKLTGIATGDAFIYVENAAESQKLCSLNGLLFKNCLILNGNVLYLKMYCDNVFKIKVRFFSLMARTL